MNPVEQAGRHVSRRPERPLRADDGRTLNVKAWEFSGWLSGKAPTTLDDPLDVIVEGVLLPRIEKDGTETLVDWRNVADVNRAIALPTEVEATDGRRLRLTSWRPIVEVGSITCVKFKALVVVEGGHNA